MKQNMWKLLFIIILLINVITIGYFWYKLTQPIEKIGIETIDFDKQAAEFVAFTSKDDLNYLINQHLDENYRNEQIRYDVLLDDYVNLTGAISVFSTDVQFKMILAPSVVENGDLKLSLQSIQLGQLRLPSSLILNAVNDYYLFPKWVSINPNEESIYVYVTKIETKSNFKIQVKTFDLKTDDISFSVFIPN